ncbi:MAG: acyl-CoA/acyl-ACP dehydrogenase [Gammaproteobacteria bacterium]|nr:acyl-CoA/acyl-ACP dehydrogenase [Gammaproteobacteria bacterium]
MNQIKQVLCEGWRILTSGIHEIQSSKREPDDIQLELYALAFAYAGLEASNALVASCSRHRDALDSDTQELLDGLVEMFVADAVHHMAQETSTIFSSETSSLTAATKTLVERFMSPKNQVRVGELLKKRGETRLPDFLSEELEAMRTSVRRLTDERIVPHAQHIHRENLTVPDSIVRHIRDMGCFGLSVPKEYGGARDLQEQDSIGMVVVTEELSRGSLGAAGSLITRPEIVVQALLAGGSEQQKQRWLPKLAQGDPLCAVAVTEPGTGSDVASVSLRAIRVKDGWRLNGAKTWCTLAGKAGLILVLARTDENATPPHRGLSLFLIEKPSSDSLAFTHESPGGGSVSGRAIETLGYRGMHSFEMFFDDFFVPSDSLVGMENGVDKGFYYTMRGFSAGRLQTAARAVGLMQSAYEASFTHCENRVVFGNSLNSYPLTISKLVRMMMYLVGTRQFSYAVAPIVQSKKGQVLASLVKLLSCRYAEWVTREAVQLHGGIGYAEESTVSRLFVDARVLSIFEGAEETLAVKVVGKALLDGVLD